MAEMKRWLPFLSACTIAVGATLVAVGFWWWSEGVEELIVPKDQLNSFPFLHAGRTLMRRGFIVAALGGGGMLGSLFYRVAAFKGQHDLN